MANGLQNPWALAFLPVGRFLVSERDGSMRMVQADGKVSAPIDGVPQVAANGQGGLLVVLLAADFARNLRLYFCFSEPAPGVPTRADAWQQHSAGTCHAQRRQRPTGKRQGHLQPETKIFQLGPLLSSDKYGQAWQSNLFVGSLNVSAEVAVHTHDLVEVNGDRAALPESENWHEDYRACISTLWQGDREAITRQAVALGLQAGIPNGSLPLKNGPLV